MVAVTSFSSPLKKNVVGVLQMRATSLGSITAVSVGLAAASV